MGPHPNLATLSRPSVKILYYFHRLCKVVVMMPTEQHLTDQVDALLAIRRAQKQEIHILREALRLICQDRGSRTSPRRQFHKDAFAMVWPPVVGLKAADVPNTL